MAPKQQKQPADIIEEAVTVALLDDDGTVINIALVGLDPDTWPDFDGYTVQTIGTKQTAEIGGRYDGKKFHAAPAPEAAPAAPDVIVLDDETRAAIEAAVADEPEDSAAAKLANILLGNHKDTQ